MRIVVHLSDLHFARVDAGLLPPLVQHINALVPDLIAVSGDLTQRARRNQFIEARAFLQRLPFPQIVVPGNHDIPLYNLPARFADPLAGYRRYISEDLEPVFTDDEIIVVGLNSARSFIFRGGGRLNEAQVTRAAARLRSAAPHLVRIIVTHHPFDLPKDHHEDHLIGRSRMAMEQLARVGADLFLAGHLHVGHVGCTLERYKIAGHSALVVQAGTLSTRGRGEAESFNVLRVTNASVTVERHIWDKEHEMFRTSWIGKFQRTPGGWSPTEAGF